MEKFTTQISRQLVERTTKDKVFHGAPVEGRVVLISINEPGDTPSQLLSEAWDDVLRCAFWDVTAPITSSHLRPSKTLDPMNEEEAEQIVDFIKANKDASIVVHCYAGVSRSAAVARLLSELGWTYQRTGCDLSGYNIHVYSTLKKFFPELLPSGI